MIQNAYSSPPAYDTPLDMKIACGALETLHQLEDRNQSAAGSLAEGLDETLTLHRLGLYGVLGRSLDDALSRVRPRQKEHEKDESQRQQVHAQDLEGEDVEITQPPGVNLVEVPVR